MYKAPLKILVMAISESNMGSGVYEVESVSTFRKPHCPAVRGWPIMYVAVCPKAKTHS